MRTAFDRLHFSAVATLGAVSIAVAVVVQHSFSLVGDGALVVAAFLVATCPILTHATARAIRISERGDWSLVDEDGAEVEDRE